MNKEEIIICDRCSQNSNKKEFIKDLVYNPINGKDDEAWICPKCLKHNFILKPLT